jgi:peptide-methionine (S)-S-oxide reductase
VYSTAVGYAGGSTPNPTYREVCTGMTGHTEVVLVAYDPKRISTEQVMRLFWEGHDPTQGMRQGNDHGTQYRSAIYWRTPEQRDAALATRDAYAEALRANHRGEITTEIAEAGTVLARRGLSPVHSPYRSMPCGSWMMLPPSTTKVWPVT